jgi:hypothetical protein
MFSLDSTTNDNPAVTHFVTGRWWFSGEHEQVHKR